MDVVRVPPAIRMPTPDMAGPSSLAGNAWSLRSRLLAWMSQLPMTSGDPVSSIMMPTQLSSATLDASPLAASRKK
jgi:hypothetical protein